MKKIFLSMLTLTALSFVSCKKDRVCECTYTSSGGSLSSSTTTIKKIRKSEAKTLCQKTTYTSSGSGSTQTDVNDCKLK